MRWPRWWRPRPAANSRASEAARQRAEAKLRTSRAQAREVRREVDAFAAAVEAALRRRA